MTVELYVEDDKIPAATKKVTVKQANEVVPITDLKWLPDRAGETKLTFRIKPEEGELVPTNNEISTYVTVQSGGLSVLYLQGPNFSWEYKYLTLALNSAPEIQATLRVIRRPVSQDPSVLPDEELTPGKYDVIILGDLPAEFLTRVQRTLLKLSVERGAGLMMLGGRSSFGAGGWAGTELAEILPTEIRAGDGQIEPEERNPGVPGAERAGKLRAASWVPRRPRPARLWSDLPKISGTNRLGPAKRSAIILATGRRAGRRACDGRPGRGPGASAGLRRRDLAVGPRPGESRLAQRPSQVLAAGDPLAGPQGRRGVGAGEAIARPAARGGGPEARRDRESSRRQGRAHDRPAI